MQKIVFKYQKWFLKIFCAGIGFFGVFAIKGLLTDLPDNIFVTIVVGTIWLYAFFKFTQHCNFFERNGAYWVENEIVYIQKGKRVFEIKDVQWLRGTTVSFYGMQKSGMLVINFEKRKIVLISSSDAAIDSFSKSEFFSLFETVLQYNPELKKNDIQDFWYETK
jgi:hypothetical protein